MKGIIDRVKRFFSSVKTYSYGLLRTLFPKCQTFVSYLLIDKTNVVVSP